LIENILRRHGLPVDYSLIVWAESECDPQARNRRSGAAGMWQLIPSTARAYGLRVDRRADERLDPARSPQAAALYLKDLVAFRHSKTCRKTRECKIKT
jgi:membrane-bound lytic murein transglycosylase D